MVAALILGLAGVSVARAQASQPSIPTLFIVGDSTAHITGNEQKYGAKKRVGWGTPFAAYFDPSKIRVVNAASAGRSSRTFMREGKWAHVLRQVKPGDFVLVQFGHNDPGGVGTGKDRGSLHGTGNETQTVRHPDGSVEIVHTFGWYLRKYVTDTRAKGAIPIILSVTPRNIWTKGKPEEGLGHYRQWAHEVAEQQHVLFVDISRIVSEDYAKLGQQKVATFFPLDHTHTDRQGAGVVARCVVAGLKGLPHHPFQRYLSAKGKSIPVTAPGYR
ncbi:MAG TPA: lysophospholipase [Acidobacterium sp.]|nr:lysophospholipase [Acidobacterium sp.]